MRTILSTIALFSLCGLCAQEYTPTYGRELPRGEILAYPSAEAATAADGGDNRYFTRLTEWNLKDNVFSTPFTVPFAWANRQVLFHLGWASGDYEVRVNGLPVACNADGNNPAEINITKQAKEGRNMLEVILAQPSSVTPLESWKEAPAPSIGGAWLMSQPTLRVRDVVTRTRMGEDGNATAEIAVAVKSEALNPRTSRIHYQLLTPTGENAAAGQKDVTLDMRREDTLRFLARIPANLLWSAELPTQYTLRLKTQHEGRYVEYLELRLGFRSVEMQDGRMSLNARPVTLRVREVPAAITENEIAALREQGFNTLKLLPGPVPESLLNFCDVQGLYVIAQAPIDTRRSGESRRKGGNPSNDPEWQPAYLERTENSYHTTKRHPSVVAFALATQSANGINLYESYLNMKRFGDSRPFIYPDAGGETGEHQVEDRGPGVHHAAGEAADGGAVLVIAQEEHGAGEDRGAVGDDVRPGAADGAGGVVIRVHAHAAGAEDEVGMGLSGLGDGGDDVLHRVAGVGHGEGLNAVGRQLAPHHGGEAVLDEALFHLAAGGDDGGGLLDVGEESQEGLVPGGLLGLLEFLLRDDQGDDPHPGQLIAFMDGGIAMAGGDHDLLLGVHGDKAGGIHQEEAVDGGGELDLALLGLAAVHVFIDGESAEALRGVVLVEHAGGHLPDVEVLLAHAEQHGNVLLRHDVALAEARVLILVLDDLRHVVAEHMAHRVLGFDKSHFFSTSISSPA